MNPKGFWSYFENLFADGSLVEILSESSLARLVDVLFDMLRVRKLFHRRMWFLMSHLSCSWRKVLIALFKEHTRKNLRNLETVLSSSSAFKFSKNNVACYSEVPLYRSYLDILLASFKISLSFTSYNYTHHSRMQYLKIIQREKKTKPFLSSGA